MPTYEYACRACGEHVEVVQSFRDDPLTTCGLCGGALRKVFSAAGIVFKGSGYYVTDSRAAKSRGDKKPEKAPAAADGDSSGSSGESRSSRSGSDRSRSDKPSSDKPSSDRSSPRHKAAESA